MNKPNDHIPSDMLHAYLDQTLEQADIQDILQHLDHCPTCLEELKRLEGIFASLESLPEVTLDKDLSIAVLSRLKEESILSRGITWTLILEALAASTVISLLIPALKTSTWLPQLIDAQTEIQAAINIFLTQLASSWLVWWAGLRLNFEHFTKSLLTFNSLPAGAISPWILVLAAAGLGVLANYFLLRMNPLGNQNHNK